MSIKLLYSAFVAVMVPCYWHTYGPQNFLYFCDMALLITLIGIWRETRLLISMEAVAILLPQVIWMADFFSRLLGRHLIGMTEYMFDPQYSLFLRGLSLFHAWLPMLLVWLVYRLGYDRRAVVYQTVVGTVVLLVCYFAFTPPGTASSWRMSVNINYVFGTSDAKAQTAMPPLLWLGIMLIGMPVLLYLPMHWLLKTTTKKGSGVSPPFVRIQPSPLREASAVQSRRRALDRRITSITAPPSRTNPDGSGTGDDVHARP